MQVKKVAELLLRGDRSALARAITVVENDLPGAGKLLALVSERRGRAFVLGVTGPPGTGKSTLVDRLITSYREKGLKIAVIAVDPTSPISGGALLGDRVRMLGHTGDAGVYIRSMASRGWSGGLTRSAAQVVRLMDAAGMDVIMIETVGIGQSDIEIVALAHAVVVVLMPGLGDDVQVSKAGLMEVGDVYVVNKGDLEGADAMMVSLLSLARSLKSRAPAVVKVSSTRREGLENLVEVIETLRRKFREDGSDMRIRSTKGMIVEAARSRLLGRLTVSANRSADALARMVLSGELTVEEAALRLSG